MQSAIGEWPDGITAVKFSPIDPGSLIVSCWDGTVSVVDAFSCSRQSIDLFSPVLDICWSNTHVCAGTLSGSLCLIENNNVTTIGHHEKAVSALALGHGTVISGSWDKSIKFWDVRSKASDTIDLPNKCFSLSSVNNTLVCGMSERLIHVYDLRMLNAPVVKESSLKHMTRRVSVMPSEKGFATCSIEGRVAIDYFGTDQGKYAFKCHRKKIQGVEHVYPVNAICFNPIRTHVLATGGADGVVNLWDLNTKKRLLQYPDYPTSISSVSFNCDGSKIAIAASYTFEQGDQEHAPDAVHIMDCS